MIQTYWIADEFVMQEELTAAQKRLLQVITLSILVCFSPIKELGQIVAVGFLIATAGYVYFHTEKSFVRLFFILLFWFTLGALYYLLLPEFSFANQWLWLLTMSAFLILAVDFRNIVSPYFLQRLRQIVMVILFLESALGIVQGIVAVYIKGSFDSDTGDLVRGTLELGFQQNATASNPIFAILTTSLFIFLFSTQLRFTLTDAICYLTFACAWVLSSVLHVYVYMCIAVLVATSLYIFRDIKRSVVITLLFITVGCALWFYILPVLMPNNVSHLSDHFEKLMDISDTSRSLKSRITYDTLVEVPQRVPLQPIIGLGPGQYSSRAALMASGYYLNGGFIYQYMSELSYRYIIQPFTVIRGTAFSSTHFPFYSWLTIYGELGMIGLVTVLTFVASLVFSILRNRAILYPTLNASLLCMIFFVCLLGFQDNYWEFTQALTPIVIFIALLRDYIRVEQAIFS